MVLIFLLLQRLEMSCCLGFTYFLTICVDFVDGIDTQCVLGYGLFKEGRHAKVSYPLEGNHVDVVRRSFHNRCFIQCLEEKASSLPMYTQYLLFLFVFSS